MKSKLTEGLKSTENLGMKYSSYLDEKDFNEMILEGRTEDEYLEDYCMIIDYALLRGLEKSSIDFYTEKHHILPRCMEGEDSNYNYVLLSALEHIVVHALLYRLYPEIISLAYAIHCMLLNNNKSIFNRKHNIELFKNRLIDSAKFIEKINNSLGKKIVAYNDGPIIIKIYETISSIRSDGFSKESVFSSITLDGSRRSGGLMWMYADDFKKLYPDQFKNYEGTTKDKLNWDVKEETRKYKSYLTSGKNNPMSIPIVCFTSNNYILKIYSYMTEAEKDGFDRSSISDAIKYEKSYSKYLWKKLSDWEDINELKNYRNREESGEVDNIKAKTLQVVCHRNNKIYKIYDNCKSVSVDGFSYLAVRDACNTGKEHRGYSWTKLFDWKDEISLNEFLLSKDVISPIPEISYKGFPIIMCDSDKKVIKLYNSPAEIRQDGFNSILQHRNKLYENFCFLLGYYWINYEVFIKLGNKVPDNFSNIDITYERDLDIQRIVKCDNNDQVIKIYNTCKQCYEENNIPIGTFWNLLRKNKSRGKCKYYRLSDYKKLYNQNLNNYYNKIENGIIIEDLIDNTTTSPAIKIVGMDYEMNNIVILESILSIKLLSENISFESVYELRKSNFVKLGGVYWMKFDYLTSNYSNEYKNANIHSINSLKKFINFEENKVVQLNNNLDILRIYKNFSDVSLHSEIKCSRSYIRSIVTNIQSPKKYKGYYWMKFSDFKEKYPDKLEEYYKQQEQK